jgi:hypothetical protein
MTGATRTSWSWLYSLAVPALVAVVDATWISTWLAVLTSYGPGRGRFVPFLVVAVVGVLAVTLSRLGQRVISRLSGPRRILAIVAGLVLAVIGLLLSAGLFDAAIGHGSWLASSFHPWTLHQTGSAALATKLTWLAAIYLWLKAVWLSREELARNQVRLDVGLAGGFLVLFFIIAAASDRPAFSHQAGPAAVLLLAAFPCAGAVLALMHERDLERRALRRPTGNPSGAWLTVVGLVLVVVTLVALVALALVVLVGPLGPWIGDAVYDVINWIGRGLNRLFSPLGHLFKGGGHRDYQPPATGTPSVLVPGIVGVIALFSAVTALLAWLRGRSKRGRRTRAAKVRSKRPELARRQAEDDDTDEIDSVFGWSHLINQLLTMIRRVLARLFGRRTDRKPTVVATPAGAPPPDSVRAQYRRLLVAAREAGQGRRPSETPLELERRLAARESDEPVPDELTGLTQLYGAVRYGTTADSAELTSEAGSQMATVGEWLRPPPVASPQPPTTKSRKRRR